MSDLKLSATTNAPLPQLIGTKNQSAPAEGSPSTADTFQRAPKTAKLQDPRAAFSAHGSGGTSNADQLKQDKDKVAQLQSWIADCESDVKRMQDEADDPQNIRQTQNEIQNYKTEMQALQQQIAALEAKA